MVYNLTSKQTVNIKNYQNHSKVQNTRFGITIKCFILLRKQLMQYNNISLPNKKASILKIQKIIAQNNHQHNFSTPNNKNSLKKYREQHLEKIKNQISELIYKQYQSEVRMNSLREISNSYDLGSELEAELFYRKTRYGHNSSLKKKTTPRQSYILQINRKEKQREKLLSLKGEVVAGERKQVSKRGEQGKVKQKQVKGLPKLKLKNRAKFTAHALFQGTFEPWRGNNVDDIQDF